MRWPIALSFGGHSQLELFVCMDMTLEKDDSEKGEIPASDLTPQGTCLGCIFIFSDHEIEVLHGLTPWFRPRKTVKPHHPSDRAWPCICM